MLLRTPSDTWLSCLSFSEVHVGLFWLGDVIGNLIVTQVKEIEVCLLKTHMKGAWAVAVELLICD